MEKHVWVIVLMAGLLGSAMGKDGLSYTIQVSKFENKSDWGQWDVGEAWTAVLTDQLNESGKFIVVAPNEMANQAVRIQDQAASPRVVQGSRTPVKGQMTPVQLIVRGIITSFDYGTQSNDVGIGKRNNKMGLKMVSSEIHGTVLVIDATTGALAASHSFEAKANKRKLSLGGTLDGWDLNLKQFKKTSAGKVMNKACKEVVDFVYKQLDTMLWTGTVVEVGNDHIVINRGHREGVTEGLVLSLGIPKEIRDPGTGELLGTTLNETGTIRITRVEQKLCYAMPMNGKTPAKLEKVYYQRSR